MKKKNKILLLILIFTILLIILLLIVKLQKTEPTNTTSEDMTYFEDTTVDKLAQMTEKERITFYFSIYIKNIENKKFDEAYNMLYDEFKNTYFDNIEKFKSYIEKKYPEIIAVDYISFQREGNYYIISVKIEDIINEKSFEQKFILREYDYNDFKLSFQAE